MSTLNTAPVPILKAGKLEKFYPQPDGCRIQVIAATDAAVYARLSRCSVPQGLANPLCCAY